MGSFLAPVSPCLTAPTDAGQAAVIALTYPILLLVHWESLGCCFKTTPKICELNISLFNPFGATGKSFGTAVSAISVLLLPITMWTEQQPGADRASWGPHSLDFSLLQWLNFATTALMYFSICKSVSLTRVHHSFWLWKPLFYIGNDSKQKAQPSWLINPHTAPPSNPRLLC